MDKGKFDLVLIFAVLQNVLDECEVNSIISNVYNRLSNNGHVLVFEATSNSIKAGRTWVRRTESNYIDIFEEHSLILLHKELISFPFFRMYELKFLDQLKRFIKGDSTQKGIIINKFRGDIKNFNSVRIKNVCIQKLTRPKGEGLWIMLGR